MAKRDPGRWDHTVSRYREDRKAAAARQAAVQRLVDAGLTVIDPPNRGDGPVRLDNLADSDGNEIDAAAHAACPGHVVALSKWDLDDVAYYCTDPVGNGHKDRWATHGSTTTAPTVVNGKMTDEAKAARREVIVLLSVASPAGPPPVPGQNDDYMSSTTGLSSAAWTRSGMRDMTSSAAVSKAMGVPLGEIIGSVILLAYAGLILYLNGRRNPGRSRDAVMAARLRATVWATIAIAILSASFQVYLLSGISIVVILSASAALIILGVRNLRHKN